MHKVKIKLNKTCESYITNKYRIGNLAWGDQLPPYYKQAFFRREINKTD
jgi:hypothetical protein